MSAFNMFFFFIPHSFFFFGFNHFTLRNIFSTPTCHSYKQKKGYEACLLFPISRYFFFLFFLFLFFLLKQYSRNIELRKQLFFTNKTLFFSCNSKYFSRQMLWTLRLPDALNVLLIWIQLAVVFVYQALFVFAYQALFVFVYQALFEVNKYGTKVGEKNVKTQFSHNLNDHIWGKYANVAHLFFPTFICCSQFRSENNLFKWMHEFKHISSVW